MFKKSTVGSQLPVQNNQYYLTVKSLKKLTNGDTVKLDQLICCTGKILKLAEKDEKDTSKLYIGSTNHQPSYVTFALMENQKKCGLTSYYRYLFSCGHATL